MTIQIVDNISDSELVEIEEILIRNDLSTYSLDKKDFIIAKEGTKIIGCGRIYSIPGESILELSSIWIDPEYRGNKLGITLCNELINKDPGAISKGLFLATKSELELYYNTLGFKKVNSDIPKKFLTTLAWAKENNIEAIIMKKE